MLRKGDLKYFSSILVSHMFQGYDLFRLIEKRKGKGALRNLNF